MFKQYLKKKFQIPTKSTYFKSEKLSPLEMFKQNVDRASYVGGFVGCDVLTPSYSPTNWRFLVCFGNCLAFIFLSFYEIYIFREDLVRCLFCLISLGISFQGVMKVKAFVFSRQTLWKIIESIEKFFTHFNTKEANQMFESWLMFSSHIGVALFVLLFLCGMLVLIYPLIFYVIMGEKILHFGFELPLIDWQTSFGYSLNFLYTVQLVYMFISSFFATCYSNILFLMMAFGQFELLKMLLEDLDETIKTNENGKKNDAIKKQIKLLAELHNELVE
jgi:hypothetical protein